MISHYSQTTIFKLLQLAVNPVSRLGLGMQQICQHNFEHNTYLQESGKA